MRRCTNCGRLIGMRRKRKGKTCSGCKTVRRRFDEHE